MNELRKVKLIRLILHNIATLLFFFGALTLFIVPDLAILTSWLYFVCAWFYLGGAIIDTYLFIKDK